MSAEQYLRCDAANGVLGRCEAKVEGPVGLTALRQHAARLGWTSWRGQDLCSAHRLAGVPTRTPPIRGGAS